MSPATPERGDAVLVASGLACRRGTRLLFEQLELQIAPGAIVWLRGPNGVGKTSLMRLLAGLSHPEAGSIAWRGVPLRQDRTAWQHESVYIGHANALKDDLTLAEALGFLAALGGHDGGAAGIDSALERFGIARFRDAPVRTLSQGQRRRGALSRLALDERPRVWILDEPHDALDVDAVARLDALLAAHAARGGSVLLTGHHEPQLAGMVRFDLGAYAPKARR